MFVIEFVLFFSNAEGFVCFLYFQYFGSAASVVQTKQHSMKPTNSKKRQWLYLFNIIIKEQFNMKENYKQSAMYIAYYQQRVSKNVMLTQIVPTTYEIYQEDFPKVINLKRSTKGAISSSLLLSQCSFYVAPHYKQSQQKCIAQVNRSRY